MKISDNIAMLEIERGDGFLYPTLVWDADHVVLIDAGLPGQTEAILKAISDAGLRAEDLTDIIITHQDMDHIGCVPDLLQLAPTARVLAHIDEAPYIDGRKTPIKLAAMLENYDSLTDEQKAFCDRLQAGIANRRISISQTLVDGEILPILGGIEVVHTPGHTPGHICLFIRGNSIMIGGDALNIEDGKMSGPNPIHTFDMELGLKSLEKIKSFDMSGAVSYHCGYLKL